MLEKIKPIEMPTERLVEVSLESSKEQEITALQTAPVQESKQAPSPQMAEPIMEDVIEPPRFGVSYLNNPAPEYPPYHEKRVKKGA